MESLALLNGTLLTQSQAALALNDAGFVFGATVTDLCRTFRQQPYRWAEHLARFRRSAAAAHIAVPFTDEQVTEWARFSARTMQYTMASWPWCCSRRPGRWATTSASPAVRAMRRRRSACTHFRCRWSATAG